MNGFSMQRVFFLVLMGSVLLSGCTTMGGVADMADQNNMAGLRGLVQQGADVNTPGLLGFTALHNAALKGNAEMVKFLLDHGANTEVEVLSVTPLLQAIWKGHTEVVRLLVAAGANVNRAQSSHGATPMTYCGAYGNAEIARILVDAGADVHAKDKRGKTAVDLAVEYKNFEVLAVLRKAGVDVPYAGDLQKDTIMAILSEDRPKVLSLLDQGADPNTKTKSGKGLLAYAVSYQWPDVVEALIKKGADVTVKDETGWTLAMTAALENQEEIVKAFEQAGVQVPYCGDKQKDLLIAVLWEDKEKVSELLSQGADVNGRYRYNSPLLNYAAVKKDIGMAELLLDKGADPNSVNSYGIGPLIAALNKGSDTSLAKYLLQRGANADVRNGQGVSALNFAVVTGDADLVRYMLERGAKPDITSVLLAQGKVAGHTDINFPEIAELLRPEVLRRQMLRAQAAVESAQSPEDYRKAIAEYNVAKELAPDLAEIYYNLGLVQEQAGFYADAIVNLQKYLQLSPGAADTQAVTDMIYKLEYKRDQVLKQ
ncbi:MAG TPA: ankyrin repeat domain-containing protein [Candidatus Omnitrophota bacterium]|nr:ankyrin repeat domain-containing protein [Candidatus Omnitrophota bacterium]HSA31105.1 ankyrin repeat domain-containing protein [Candidatus Omnitrophota bacterium]